MEHNVSCILNCAAECANHHTEKLHYLHLRLLDKPEESIRRAFEPAFSFLQKAHDAGHVSHTAVFRRHFIISCWCRLHMCTVRPAVPVPPPLSLPIL